MNQTVSFTGHPAARVNQYWIAEQTRLSPVTKIDVVGDVAALDELQRKAEFAFASVGLKATLVEIEFRTLIGR